MQLRNAGTATFNEDKGGKGRHFIARFIQPGLCSYKGNGGQDILITQETLNKIKGTIVGCPVIIDHDDITDENVRDKAVGFVSNVWFNAEDGWFYCDGIVQGENVETLIEEKGYFVSCAYQVTDKTKEGGVWHDLEYDAEILDGYFEHLAIVKNPRYRDATILLNSSDLKEREEKMFSIFNSKTKRLKNSTETKEKEKNMAETTDKRKAISEVEAMLFEVKDGKRELSEEMIKTIIGLMEEDAYTKSEADAKDNESDKEDDKKDDEKENSKKRNSEDDKKENEDDKDDDKKEDDKKENKCRNSSSYFDKLEKLRNSREPTPTVKVFETEKERLARGMDY